MTAALSGLTPSLASLGRALNGTMRVSGLQIPLQDHHPFLAFFLLFTTQVYVQPRGVGQARGKGIPDATSAVLSGTLSADGRFIATGSVAKKIQGGGGGISCQFNFAVVNFAVGNFADTPRNIEVCRALRAR